MLQAVGNPHRHFPSIHIGGTNGKGSVACMVYQGLRAAGFRVGLYTSPHLVDFTERIVVDDVPMSEDALATWTGLLRPGIDETGASFFEATTAMAFADFAARQVDVAVVEVGLGGRLDATNVLKPMVAAVTNVGLEHAEYLGETVEEIALEKAGIAKTGTPFVIGEPQPRVSAALERAARRKGARVVVVAPESRYRGALSLAGAHQRRNAAVAVAVLERLPRPFAVPGRAIRQGLSQAWLPGRFDRRGRWLFDVAHNPGGIAALVATLREHPVPRPVHTLFAALSDKDAAAMLSALGAVSDRIWVTVPPSAPPERRRDPADLGRPGPPPVVVEAQFDAALAAAQEGGGTILVTGSFHTVGDAMVRLPAFRPLG